MKKNNQCFFSFSALKRHLGYRQIIFMLILFTIGAGSCVLPGQNDPPSSGSSEKVLMLKILLDTNKGIQKAIETNTYEITSLDITVHNLDTQQQIASLVWLPEKGETAYSLPVKPGSRYKIDVVHHGIDGDKTIDFKESTEVAISIMKIAEVVIYPGAGIVFSVPEEPVNSGKVFNIYCWSTILQDRFEWYSEKASIVPEDVVINWVIIPDDYQNVLDDALSMQDSLPADKKIDLFLLEAEYALKFVDAGCSLDVVNDIGLSEADLSNMFPYTKDIMTDSHGVLKGVSWQACPGGYVYRRSFMRDVIGTDDPAFVQQALNTWDKFDALAAQAKKKGYFMLSGYDDAFRVFSDNKTSKWVLGNQINIDPQIERWIDQTKLYAEMAYNNRANLWSGEMFSQMGGDGKVMGYFGPGWFIDFVLRPYSKADPDGPDEPGNGSYGDWGLVKGPQGFSWGGTWLCGAAGSDNIDLIKKIMRFFAVDTETMKSLRGDFGDFINNRSVMQEIAESDYSNNFLGGQRRVSVLLDSADSINRDNISLYDQGMNEQIQSAFFDYFDGAITKEQAWDNFYSGVLELYPYLVRPESAYVKNSNLYIQSTVYDDYAYCLLNYVDDGGEEDYTIFNDAEVRIDEILIPQFEEGKSGFFHRENLNYSYSFGDIKILKINHPLIKNLVFSETIPPSPSVVMVDNHEMSQFIAREIDLANVSWNRVVCDFYVVFVSFFDKDMNYITSQMIEVSETSTVINNDFIENQEESSRVEIVKIEVFAVNKKVLNDFAYNTSLESRSNYQVYSPSCAEWSNFPEESN